LTSTIRRVARRAIAVVVVAVALLASCDSQLEQPSGTLPPLVTVAAIQAVNDPATLAVIHPHDTIVLPAGARRLTSADVSTTAYVVQPGDNIIDIAKAHSTRPAELLAINNKLSAPDVLRAGERILIPRV